MVSFGSLLVFTFGVFLKPLSAEFGWSREAISSAFGFAALSVAISSPRIGQLLDRYGPRGVIIPCMMIFGAGIGSLAFLTPHLWHLYAVFVVLGLIGNGSTQMGYSRAVATWFDERRGMALAFVMAGTGAGSIVLPALAQAIIGHYGWRAAYAVLGALVFVAGLPLTLLFVREKSSASKTESAAPLSGATVRAGLRSRAFWIIVGSLFLGSISVNGAITHMDALLTDRGIPATDAALALSTLGAFSFGGRLIAGYLLDRFFGPRVAVVLSVGVAAGIFTLGQAHSAHAGLIAAALIGLGLGGEAAITPYLLTRYFGLRSFSTLYGLTWTAYALAGAIGPVLMGRAFDLTGSYESFLTVLTFAMIASAGIMLVMPRYASEPRA
jgi:MFS family permease